MRRLQLRRNMTSLVLLVLLSLAVSDGLADPMLVHPKLVVAMGKVIPGEFLVLMKPGSEAVVAAAKMRVLNKAASADPSMGFMDEELLPPPDLTTPGVPQVLPLRSTSIAALKAVLDDPDVAVVEPNQHIEVDCSAQSTPLWGLGRVSGRATNVSHFQYDGNGSSTIVYVIDTGVLTSHPDFGGRAQFGTCVYVSTNASRDFDGHGTHVAGTVGGSLFGASRNANIISIRVFSDSGSSNSLAVYYGILWAFSHHLNETELLNPLLTNSSYYKIGSQPPGFKRAKGVINMSFGATGSAASFPSTEYLLQYIADYGMISVAAAGNDGKDACDYYPASSSYAVTVGCLDQNDTLCYFSNHGSCVDILAPGNDIYSAYYLFHSTGFNAYLQSGTSQASPLVAGVISNYISITNPTPTLWDIKTWLDATATRDVVCHDNEPYPRCTTTNNVLFSGCGANTTTHAYSTTNCSACVNTNSGTTGGVVGCGGLLALTLLSFVSAFG